MKPLKFLFLFLLLLTGGLFSETCIEIDLGGPHFKLASEGCIHYDYNAAGEVSAISYFDSLGNSYATYEMQYDLKGNLQAKTLTQASGRANASHVQFSYTYQKDKERVSQKPLLASIQLKYGFLGYQSNYYYEYNDSLQLIALRFCEGRFFPQEKYHLAYSFDSQADLLFEVQLIDMELVSGYYKYKYDLYHRFLEMSLYDHQLALQSSWIAQYHHSRDPHNAHMLSHQTLTQIDAKGKLLAKKIRIQEDGRLLEEVRLEGKDLGSILVTKHHYNDAYQLETIIDYAIFSATKGFTEGSSLSQMDEGNVNIVGSLKMNYDEKNRLYLLEYKYDDLNLLEERLEKSVFGEILAEKKAFQAGFTFDRVRASF